jgi:hypothetical protein
MSDDKKNSDDVNATVMMPVQDVGATQIIPPEKSSAEDNIGATSFIAPKPHDVDTTQVFASIDLNESGDLLGSDGATKIMPAVKSSVDIKAGKTGEMEVIPSSQASAFDILLGRTGVVATRQFELKKNKLTIGRSPFNDIIIKSDAVSASHAELERGKGRWILRDIGSINGVSVNGEYGGKGDEFDLSISDQILIGDVVLQLCSPHTIDEMLATPLKGESSNDNKSNYIIAAAVAVAIVAVIAAVLLV